MKTLRSQLQLERKKRLEEEAVAHEKMLKQAIVADKKLVLIAKQAAEMEVACLVLIMFFLYNTSCKHFLFGQHLLRAFPVWTTLLVSISCLTTLLANQFLFGATLLRFDHTIPKKMFLVPRQWFINQGGSQLQRGTSQKLVPGTLLHYF